MSAATDFHNPYLAARYIHNERYCSLTKSIRNWQLVGGALLLANIGLASGLVYVTSQQQIAPYIVEVDAAGSAVAIRDLMATSVQDPRVIGLQLTDWILKIRRLSTDATLRKLDTDKAFAICLTPAQNYIRAYYADNPVAETLKHGAVYPKDILVVPRTEKSWSASWREEIQNAEGNPIAIRKWEALIEIALVLPTKKSERDVAPLGVWVERVQWNERNP
jgi:type IV secretion system protein TrbF